MGCRRPLGWTVFLVLWTATFPTARAADIEPLAPLLERWRQSDQAPARQEVCAAALRLGPAAVAALAARLTESATGGDAAERVLLHGLSLYATRPDAAAQRPAFAQALCAAVRPERPAEVNAFLLEQLRFTAGPECTGAVEAWLTDERLHEYAARVLLTIPDARGAAAAFRAALPKARGRALLTVLDALGRLRDADAVPALLEHARAGERDVRLAALDALARIGDARAADALRAAVGAADPFARDQAADALFLFALRRAEQGDRDGTERLCRAFREQHPQSPHAQCAALAGLVMVRGPDALAELEQALTAGSAELRGCAELWAARLPGEAITRAWAARLQGADPAKRLALLRVLERRGDPVALAALTDAVQEGDVNARLFAVEAAGLRGVVQTVPHLVALIVSAPPPDPRLQAAAKVALARLRGSEAGAAVAAAMPAASDEARAALLWVLGRQLDPAHTPLAIRDLEHAEERVRIAALEALRDLRDPAAVPALLARLRQAPAAAELAAAEQALGWTCEAMAAGETRTAPLLAAYHAAAPRTQAALLRVLTRLGGAPGLAVVVRELQEAKHAEVQEAAVRALCDWPDAAAREPLLALAKTAATPARRVLALRGLARLLGTMTREPPEARAASYGAALALAERPEEQKLLLSGLGRVGHRAALDLLDPFLTNEAVKDEAQLAYWSVARQLPAATARPALARLLAVCTNAKLLEELKKKERELAGPRK